MLAHFRPPLCTLTFSALMIVAIATGCRQTPEESTTAPAEETTETTSVKDTNPDSTAEVNAAKEILAEEIKVTQPWKIAYVLKTTNPQSPFTLRVGEGAKQAGEKLDVEVQVFTTGKTGPVEEFVEDQIKEVLKAIEQGDIDGMVIAPAESVRIVPVIEKAIDAGIPVIAMDTPVDTDRILTYVKFDNFAAGKAIGEWVVEQLDGRGKAVLINGPLEQQNAIDRRDGFLAGLETGDIEILATESTSWEIEEAKAITKSWLDRFPEIDVLISANDRMAIGAIEEIEAADREGILVTGLDAVEEGLTAIQAGKLGLTADQLPELQALLAVKMLVLHLEDGRTFAPVTPVPEIPLITTENVADYL